VYRTDREFCAGELGSINKISNCSSSENQPFSISSFIVWQLEVKNRSEKDVRPFEGFAKKMKNSFLLCRCSQKKFWREHVFAQLPQLATWKKKNM